MKKLPKTLLNLFHFNQYTRKNHYYYKDHYYSSLQKTTFQKILEYMLEDTKYLNSTSLINFRNIPFSTPKKDVIKVNGKPTHSIVHTYNEMEYITLHYKLKLGKYRTSAILYFIDDFFFCGQYLFKETYHEIDISDTLTLKYLGVKMPDLLQSPIKDMEGNVLVFNSDVITLITYICGSKDFREYIRNEQSKFYLKMEKARQESLHILNMEL